MVDKKIELGELQEKYKSIKDAVKKTVVMESIKTKEKEIRDTENKSKKAEEDFASQNKEQEAKIMQAKRLFDEIKKFQEEGKVFWLTDDLRKVNESNYSYVSEKVKMKKDEVKFNFTAKADGQLTCNKPNEEKFEVILRTEGGVKLDFSTGAFFNFGSDDFLGRDYYYKPINDSTSIIKAADKGKRGLLSIGALMHIYERSPGIIKVGGVIGASSTTALDGLNFHIGASIIIGDRERLCLSAGLTFRETKLLDRNFVMDIPYNKKQLPESIPTIKKFPETGYFISLTYNISKFSK